MLPSAAAVLEDGNLASEILLRLPPQPSSLPRASAVCRSLRNVTSDPGFSRRFRFHHRRSRPLLGCFMRDGNELRFEPTLDPPNRVPQGRFPFPIDASDFSFRMLGCRHGFLLMLHKFQGTVRLLVWDPFNGHEHPLAIPPGFGKKGINGTVLRAAPGVDHFQVVLVRTDVQQGVVACVYSSETGVWGNLIATPLPSGGVIDPSRPAVLVGGSLYMLLLGIGGPSRIVEFDVGTQSLALIPLPACLDSEYHGFYSVMRADGGGLGIVFVSAAGGSAQLWKTKTSCEGVDSWMLARTLELDKLIAPGLKSKCFLQITGLAEENNVVFLWSFVGLFMVQLDSLQFKRLPDIDSRHWHPFESVYAAEWVHCRVVELEKTIPVADPEDELSVIGFAEGVGVIFVSSGAGLFMIKLNSGQVKKVDGPGEYFSVLPYMSFYLPKTGNGGGHDATDLLHST